MGNAASSMNTDMEQCIDNCLNCHRIFLQTITHCLSMGGPHAAPDHIRLMLDCVDICQASAHFMLRGSDLHTRTCRVCAEVCDLCAQDCAKMNDPQMQPCVDACRRCAKSCQQMSEAVV